MTGIDQHRLNLFFAGNQLVIWAILALDGSS